MTEALLSDALRPRHDRPDRDLAPLLRRIESETGLSFRAGDGRLEAALAECGGPVRAASRPDDPAWRGFLARLLIHETYFFRHPRQIAALRRDVLPALAAAARREGRGTIAIWSASCSTGEEAWTVALAARDALAGSATDFRVQASDLSEAALATARRGTYAARPGLGSFRGPPDALALPGLGAGQDGWRAPDDLRRHVAFFAHNLMDPPAFGPVDLVLCRNTLIYFGAAARRRAIGHLAAVLRPGGCLALGPAETPEGDPRFETDWGGNAMLFRRGAAP